MTFGKITVGCSFPIALAAVVVMCSGKLLAAFLLAALIHELGHCAAIILCGGSVDKIHLSLTGASIQYSLRNSTAGRRMIVSAAGPAAGAAFAASVSALGCDLAAGASAALTFFNLLPVSVMDGGRILYEIADSVFGTETAGNILLVSSCVCSLAVTCAGIAGIKAGAGSASLLIMGAGIFSVSVLRCCKKGFRGV